MRKLLDKWYFSLIIIPLLLTYLTNYYTLPKLFSDWKASVILSLLLFCAILLIELKIKRDELIRLKAVPSPSDIKLIKKLDTKAFEEEIFNNDAWNGYKQEAIHSIIDYQYASNLIKNKVTNQELNEIISNFNQELKTFIDFSSRHLYGHEAGFLIPFKYDNKEKAKEDSEKMNELCKSTFEKFKLLISYLKMKKYI